MSIWKKTNHDSIQARLLVAVGLLTLSALVVGLTSWYWLSHSNRILEDLHTSTIQQVNRSHELTKQSAVFTASATFLLNLKSPYLVETEGSKLLDSIDNAIGSWEKGTLVSADGSAQPKPILSQLQSMRSHISSLIASVQKIAEGEDESRLITQQLAFYERQMTANLKETRLPSHREAIRQVQVATQLLITASYETSLLSLGEYRRRIIKLFANFPFNEGFSSEESAFEAIHQLALNEYGLFYARRQLLQSNVDARRALSGISSSANQLNILVLDLIQRSEAEIALQRENTSKNIKVALWIVALLGVSSIVMALIAAFYISGYVVKNLNTVTQAMSSLARDDFNRENDIPETRMDEIGRLKEAFKVFRANAFKLKRLNKQLVHKTALFETTFNNINDGVAITDNRGRVLACNPRLNQVLSYFAKDVAISLGTELTENTLQLRDSDDLIDVSNDSQWYREIRNGLGQSVEIRRSNLPDGGAVWLFSDTTERRRIEERLSHFQRLESLGQLTGEVAHDFNNILSVIKTAVHLALSRNEDTRVNNTALYRIDDAVDIGTALTQRLLAFASKQNLDPAKVELNELVAGVSELIALSLGDRINLTIKESDSQIYVFVDRIQLESALLNLSINSANATQDEGDVKISVSVNNSNNAVITVRDYGCGMSKKALVHAIEPFYSTNKGRSGSGLGLSIVYGFLKQSGGDLVIDSEEGVGTSVHLAFPQYNPTVSSEKIYPGLKSTNPHPILLVEDDLESRIRALQYFKELGLQAHDIADYPAAKACLLSEEVYSVLFTDVHLGGNNTGWDLARYCLAHNSVGKIVVTSGRGQELKKPPEDLKGHVVLLPKPYSQQDLTQIFA
ncbi:MAG: ATP-binding protein [Granulosicoccus sp.]